MNPNNVQLPSIVSDTVGLVFLIMFVLVGFWTVLRVVGAIKRRTYNLSSAESTAAKGPRPDFLTVDHDQRQRRMNPERKPDPPDPPLVKALTWSRIAMVFAAFGSFLSSVLYAFMGIASFDEVWRNLSVWERFSTIIRSYPVGFVLASVLVLAAVIRMAMALRDHQKAIQ